MQASSVRKRSVTVHLYTYRRIAVLQHHDVVTNILTVI